MNTTTFPVRVGRSTKSRLEKLAKNTGRSRSFLAAEAISAYLDTNEWQVAGIAKALASLDRGKGRCSVNKSAKVVLAAVIVIWIIYTFIAH